MAEVLQRIAWVFPGQGTQRIGMGKDLFNRYPAVKILYEKADDTLGYQISKLSFEGPEEKLKSTPIAQPAIVTYMEACLIALKEEREEAFMVAPGFLAGQSLGEYPALSHAGAFSFEDELMLVQARGNGMGRACELYPSGLYTVKMDPDNEALLEQLRKKFKVYPSLINDQVVIGGLTENLSDASLWLKGSGFGTRPLEVAGAFHTILMKPAIEPFVNALGKVRIKPLKTPVIANTTAEPIQSVEEIKKELVNQLTLPVRWRDTLRMLHSEVDCVVEVGEHGIVVNMLKRLFKGTDKKIIIAAGAAGITTLAIAWYRHSHE